MLEAMIGGGGIKPGKLVGDDVAIGILDGFWVLIPRSGNRFMGGISENNARVGFTRHHIPDSFQGDVPLDSKQGTDIMMEAHEKGDYEFWAAARCRELGPEYHLPSIDVLEFIYPNRSIYKNGDPDVNSPLSIENTSNASKWKIPSSSIWQLNDRWDNYVDMKFYHWDWWYGKRLSREPRGDGDYVIFPVRFIPA